MKICAITTYYNPAGYISRRKNYTEFRKRLSIPLVTVELANNVFELGRMDADILLQVRSPSVLWHKERLLNIALDNVPTGTEAVAWIDCDTFFEDDGWIQDLQRALVCADLVQLFSKMYDVTPDGKGGMARMKPGASGRGIAYLVSSNLLDSGDFQPEEGAAMRKGLFGLAWAAPLELMLRHRFYDTMICGSGDRALACAAWGRFSEAASTAFMTTKRELHYRSWGQPFFGEVGGRVGYLERPLYHIWHGEIANRKYLERHKRIAEIGFDPEDDLKPGSSGEWCLRDPDGPLSHFLKSYFAGRQEDG
ncbi:conserved hypothetical protein [Bosea sp. 62]|uniref:hypothetical protein n=1 Tax=unclassified Bosea (in: a-proteobacteria) TaxID=2653178 RepID=UPI0012517369|nr:MULTISPECIES: hypothetical protein [unclassified Bosea (in: a-proteobacteria)]CAD5261122.1 conserved hypothetical protein [Bosea sp. 7B]CAD5271459.1 conserved hypothetical protein [Bosea sp. 21B]CAD5273593.1 conserved hypothetical protein [Bosea sp. 46]VVT56163.1 conserved hypothetical protein [Bosea sp. EC-HK365B]VXB63961.1 conserved hypothetical protein [Bosea sp. 62]